MMSQSGMMSGGMGPGMMMCDGMIGGGMMGGTMPMMGGIYPKEKAEALAMRRETMTATGDIMVTYAQRAQSAK